MSAQPVESAPQRIVLPRKIKAIRAALTPDEQEQFTAELEDTEAGGLVLVVQKWWTHAVINLTPGAWDRIHRAEMGTLPVVPIEDVLPELRGRV